MKISFAPKSLIGKVSLTLSIYILFVAFFEYVAGFFRGSNDYQITKVLGFICLIGGIIAFKKRDRTIGTLIPLVFGMAITTSAMFSIINPNTDSFNEFEVKSTLTAEEAGSMEGKTANFTTVAENDCWIYYVFENQLYKRKNDWTQRTQIFTGKVANIFISGDYIYCLEDQMGGAIFRVNLDGSGQTIVVDYADQSYLVEGDWVYYLVDFSLYKVKVDGTEKTKLVNGSIYCFAVFDDWIYYSIEGASSGSAKDVNLNANLCKIRTDGTENSILVDNLGCLSTRFFVSEDWLYFTACTDDNQSAIFKTRLDGTEKTEIKKFSGGVFEVFFSDDFIYYSTATALYRMNLEDNSEEKLNEIKAGSIQGFSGDWFYMREYHETAFRVKLDGSIGTRLN